MFFDGADLTISGSAITGNTAGGDGGGLSMFSDAARSRTRLSAATRRSSSIAAAASGSSATFALNVTVADNTAEHHSCSPGLRQRPRRGHGRRWHLQRGRQRHGEEHDHRQQRGRRLRRRRVMSTGTTWTAMDLRPRRHRRPVRRGPAAGGAGGQRRADRRRRRCRPTARRWTPPTTPAARPRTSGGSPGRRTATRTARPPVTSARTSFPRFSNPRLPPRARRRRPGPAPCRPRAARPPAREWPDAYGRPGGDSAVGCGRCAGRCAQAALG